MIILAPPVKYRGTLTGLRISSVGGTALIDNAGATIPTLADGNHQIEIYDAEGRMLKGVLKAAGSAETLSGVELTTDGEFTDTANWTEQTNWAVAGGVAASTGSNAGQSVYQVVTTATNVLYKATTTISAYTSGYGSFILGALSSASPLNSSNTFSYYATGIVTSSVNFGLKSGSTPLVGESSVISLQSVTAPSTSGCTIVSAKGGTTYNFAYKNASFTYNSTYTVIVRAIR